MIVYTAIFNKYDKLRDIILPAGWRAICFTDDLTLTSQTWEIAYLEPYPLIHRHIKACPDEFLLDYDRCIWIDGNLEYLGGWESLDLPGFWAMRHPERLFLEHEIRACIQLGKDGEHIKELNQRYGAQKVVATGVLIRENDVKTREFGRLWWAEIKEYSHRDQLSFGYCAEKTGLEYNLFPFLNGFIKHKHALGHNQ